MKRIGVVLCSRAGSERVPGKPFRLVNDFRVIDHLVNRISKIGIPVIVSVPFAEQGQYEYLASFPNVIVDGVMQFENDPLGRMNYSAGKHLLDAVVRVTHDKILVDPDDVFRAIDAFRRKNLDYLYGSKFVPGTGFEIISKAALETAANKYRDVEFVSYAIRAVTNNSYDFDPKHPIGHFRFLIDFPEDLQLFEVLFSQLGNDASMKQCVEYLRANPWLKKINEQPKLTLYTCVYNGDEHILRCLRSVAEQVGYSKFEHLIVDDHSTDRTMQIVSSFCLENPNARWIRNHKNVGLASSSNIALKQARGKYIMRLDADDFLTSKHALREMIYEMEHTGKEAIYPNNYYGSRDIIQNGKDQHHVGGAIFEKRAINHVKFTDGLRGYEGLDFFQRARDQLDVGYLARPIFFYTQREGSMSRSNLEERARLKAQILERTP